MGSRARVVLYAPDEASAAAAAAAAFAEMDRLNAVLSDYDPSSEAMRLCRTPGVWVEVSPVLLDILLKSRELRDTTEGAFDPTIGPLTTLWRQARRVNAVPDVEEIRQALSLVGMQFVEINAAQSRVRLRLDNMRLDFGAIGKGYAADRALDVLEARGFPAALVDLGGDIAIGRPPPVGTHQWMIARDGDHTPSTAHPMTGVATSGARFQFIEADGVRYSHIIDPRTGYGVTAPVSVTVTADEAWLADALASAVSVSGEAGAARLRSRYPGVRIDIRHDADARTNELPRVPGINAPRGSP